MTEIRSKKLMIRFHTHFLRSDASFSVLLVSWSLYVLHFIFTCVISFLFLSLWVPFFLCFLFFSTDTEHEIIQLIKLWQMFKLWHYYVRIAHLLPVLHSMFCFVVPNCRKRFPPNSLTMIRPPISGNRELFLREQSGRDLKLNFHFHLWEAYTCL